MSLTGVLIGDFFSGEIFKPGDVDSIAFTVTHKLVVESRVELVVMVEVEVGFKCGGETVGLLDDFGNTLVSECTEFANGVKKFFWIFSFC